MTDEKKKELAKKHNLSEEQIELVYSSLFDGVRYYLSHPLEAKGGVMLHNLITFYINKKRLKRQIEIFEIKLPESKYVNTAEKLEFFKELLNNTYKYERQTSKPNKYK